MKNILIGILLLSLFSFEFIENNKSTCRLEAEVIAFDPLKCGICWGWIIKVNNDTIKTRDNLHVGFGELVGYRFRESVPVYISIGDSLHVGTRDYPYYQITCLEKRIK